MGACPACGVDSQSIADYCLEQMAKLRRVEADLLRARRQLEAEQESLRLTVEKGLRPW